jgi:hypothetical protein
MRDNEYVQHPSRPLAPTFSTLNSAGINDPEGPEKYNNTEVKYGATFYSCHATLDTLKFRFAWFKRKDRKHIVK